MTDILNSLEGEEFSEFENIKNEANIDFWWASDLMKLMNYPNMKAFHKVIDKTTKTFVTLNIPYYENIIPEMNTVNGDLIQDFKLTRFACYITVMNGDTKKIEVAQAQAYFATQTRKFELSLQNSNEIDRLLIRDEIIEGNKSLVSTAHKAGLTDFARFQNAGYRGMYNMFSIQLEKQRGVKKGKLMDNMGRTELAANLFRITQTEEKIKNNNITGQNHLEQTHFEIGREVRNIVIKNVGKTPENLPQSKELPEVKKEIKKGYKNMLKEDKKNKR